MLICAPIAISLGGVSLLEEGDWCSSLPKIDVQVAGEDLAFIGASHAEPLSRGNQVNRATFTRYVQYPSVADAALALAAFSSWVPQGGSAAVGAYGYTYGRLLSAGAAASEVDATIVIQTFSLAYA